MRTVAVWAIVACPDLVPVCMLDIDVAVPKVAMIISVMRVVTCTMPGWDRVHLEPIAVFQERVVPRTRLTSAGRGAIKAPIVDGSAARHLDTTIQRVVQGQIVEVEWTIVWIGQQPAGAPAFEPADVSHVRRRPRPWLALQLLDGANSVPLIPAPGQVVFVFDPGYLTGRGPGSGEWRHIDDVVMVLMERHSVDNVVLLVLEVLPAGRLDTPKPAVFQHPVSVAAPASTPWMPRRVRERVHTCGLGRSRCACAF